MTPVELASSLYRERRIASARFTADISAHYRTGYVINTPQMFLMFRGVRTMATPELISDPGYKFLIPDAWFIWVFAAVSPVTILEILDFQPHQLPYIGWARDDKRRFYNSATIFRRCNMTFRSIPPCNL